MRTPSPTDMDAIRIAERLYLDFGTSIKDERTFKEAYSSYFQGSLTDGIKKLEPQVFKHLRAQHPKIQEGDLFKKAGGKDFQKDRKHTAKKLVATPEAYVHAGARKSDLREYDTQAAGKRFTKLSKRYDLIGNIRGVTVRIAPDTFRYKGKVRNVYRDAKGRFAKRI